MTDKIFRATVEVVLSDTMDETPMSVLSSIIVTALVEADIPTLSAKFEEVSRVPKADNGG